MCLDAVSELGFITMTAVQGAAFRRAAVEDADAIRDTVRSAYAKWVPIIGREPRPMVADYQQAVQKHDVDMLFSDNALVGLIETIQHRDHLWIENIAVLPEHQGKGWGKHLLAYADQKASEASCNEVRLLTNEAFTANVALYERSGYRIDKKEPFHLGGTTVYMSKKLGNAASA